MDDEADQMLYLMRHPNGYYRIVGEEDNWTVSYEMAGDVVRLFTAAPEMLAALKEVADGCEYRLRKGEDSGDRQTLRLCRAAINKAEGSE